MMSLKQNLHCSFSICKTNPLKPNIISTLCVDDILLQKKPIKHVKYLWLFSLLILTSTTTTAMQNPLMIKADTAARLGYQLKIQYMNNQPRIIAVERLTAGSLRQQENGTPQRSLLGFKSVQLK